jgi:hypothetical protein
MRLDPFYRQKVVEKNAKSELPGKDHPVREAEPRTVNVAFHI